jgi:predicted RNA-binding protein with PUA-like domain
MSKYWLFKSEPEAFSIDDLKKCSKKTDWWDGVRNYQARNFMRDDMKKGDYGLFYHSNCKEIGVVGIVEITKEAKPDVTAFDSDSKYFDAKSSEDKPRWFNVAVTFKEKFNRTVSLDEIKEHPGLEEMKIVQRGNRLSITPVTKKEFNIISKLGLK